MFRANIKFVGGSELNDIHLYKSIELWTSMIVDKKEAETRLSSWDLLYFGNDYIQGHFIPSHIESYELNDLSDEELERHINKKLLKELSEL